MKAFVFTSDGTHPTRAVTTEAGGENLPPTEGDWRAEGQIDLDVDSGGMPASGIDRADMVEKLEKYGYVLMPQDPTTPRPENQKRQL